MPPEVTVHQPEQGLDSSAWPLPSTPAIPTISPATQVEVDAFDLNGAVGRGVADRQLTHRQNDAAWGLRRPLHRQAHGAADHHADKFVLVCRRSCDRGDAAAVAQHSDAVGDRQHLVHLMGHNNDRSAGVAQRPQDDKQPLHLLGRENRGGLVENQDPRVPKQQLQDFDALAHADRQPLNDRIGIDAEAIGV